MQTAPPRLPFVSRLWRNVKVTAYAGLFERFSVRLGIATEASASASTIAAEFAAAVADKHDFDLLFEAGHIGDVVGADAAAAENADVGKCIEVGQGDRSGLHATHG